jgi:hypothetical protein
MRSGFLGPPPLPPMFRGTTPFLSRLSRPCERPAAGLSELPWASSRPIARQSWRCAALCDRPLPALLRDLRAPSAPPQRESPTARIPSLLSRDPRKCRGPKALDNMGTWNLVIGTLLGRVSMAVQQGARICPLHPLSTLCSPPSTDGSEWRSSPL